MASMRHSRIREVQDLAVNEQLELRNVISGCSLETIFTPTTWGNGHKYDVLNIGCLMSHVGESEEICRSTAGESKQLCRSTALNWSKATAVVEL